MNKEKKLQCGNLSLPITTEQNNGKKINIFSFLIDLAYVSCICYREYCETRDFVKFHETPKLFQGIHEIPKFSRDFQKSLTTKRRLNSKEIYIQLIISQVIYYTNKGLHEWDKLIANCIKNITNYKLLMDVTQALLISAQHTYQHNSYCYDIVNCALLCCCNIFIYLTCIFWNRYNYIS